MSDSATDVRTIAATLHTRDHEPDMTDPTEINAEIEELEMQILEKKKQLVDLRRQAPDEPVDDYSFENWDGETISLSELFDEAGNLIVVHNMGKNCQYCTLWADGFDGVVDHLQDRTNFVVVSPDPPDQQREFAEARGWEFDMLSDTSGAFSEAVGYKDDNMYKPGFSALRQTDDGEIYRTGHRPFGPRDDFSAVWHFFDLLADAESVEWHPQFDY